MKVTLLGTGSADGWPNAFCVCASCEAERAARRSRQPSSALVDDVLLIDCGPTTPHAVSAAGRSLNRVEHVFLTHGHPDHLDPAFLLSREWVSLDTTVHVWGPPAAIDLCRPWTGPQSPVHFHVVEPGSRHEAVTAAGAYLVDVVPAAHANGNGDVLAEEAVLYMITDPHQQRLLYATDTAELTSAAMALIGGPISLVLVDETFGDHVEHGTGHLDLSTLPRFLDALRNTGATTSDTMVVATHLSHHNPPTTELRSRLAVLGVHVVDDLTVLDTDPARRRAAPARSSQLVLGGARSGKSRYAESLALQHSEVLYVATGGARPDDQEWQHRVAVHRARRPDHWTTVESLDLDQVVRSAAGGSVVLIDCIALWLTGHLDRLDAWARLDRGERALVAADVDALVDCLIEALGAAAADVVLVSNEVGMGVVPGTSAGRAFQDLLGTVNARLAAACDRTTLLVAGQPLVLAGAGE